MSIESDLQILQSSLSETLEIDVSLVLQLRDTPDADQGLMIWPWHIETARSLNRLLPQQSPGDGRLLSPPLRKKIHLLILAVDFSTLSRAFDVLCETPVLVQGDRTLNVVLNTLTADQACSIFTACHVPMQAAISLTLEG